MILKMVLYKTLRSALESLVKSRRPRFWPQQQNKVDREHPQNSTYLKLKRGRGKESPNTGDSAQDERERASHGKKRNSELFLTKRFISLRGWFPYVVFFLPKQGP